jgi:exodeoxyribonuclease III
LLEWLAETVPDVACLQEIKTEHERFPYDAIERAGYGALVLGQRSHHGVATLAKGGVPREIRRGLPGDDEDRQSRYLEAEVDGVIVASVYLPNGNPQPGPKFDYKLVWFERLIAHARALVDFGQPVVLAGDFNVVPTNADIYNAWVWRWDAVMQPQTREAWQRLLALGWSDGHAALVSEGPHLHLLGQRRLLPAQRRLSYGLPAAQRRCRRTTGEHEGRRRIPRPRARERSCARVGRAARRCDAGPRPAPLTWNSTPSIRATRPSTARAAISASRRV